jgi:hypothetical protein
VVEGPARLDCVCGATARTRARWRARPAAGAAVRPRLRLLPLVAGQGSCLGSSRTAACARSAGSRGRPPARADRRRQANGLLAPVAARRRDSLRRTSHRAAAVHAARRSPTVADRANLPAADRCGVHIRRAPPLPARTHGREARWWMNAAGSGQWAGVRRLRAGRPSAARARVVPASPTVRPRRGSSTRRSSRRARPLHWRRRAACPSRCPRRAAPRSP